MEQQQSTRMRLAEDQQAANSDITEQELVRRKDFLEFGDNDVANLTKINDLASQYSASVIEDFYKHLLSFEETRTFFRDPRTLQRVKNAQQDYFLRLTQGKYDLAYAQNRLVIGATHERTGLPIKSYLGMYNYYLRAVAGRLREAFATQQDRDLKGRFGQAAIEDHVPGQPGDLTGPQASLGSQQHDHPVPEGMPGATGKDQEVTDVATREYFCPLAGHSEPLRRSAFV